HALVPNGLNKAQAKLWRDAARETIRQYATEHRMLTLDLRDVPAILADHLAAYDMAPEEAWTRMRNAFAGNQSVSVQPVVAAVPNGAAPRQPHGGTTPVAGATRAAAAAIAPGGAGAPAAALPTPPSNQTVTERLEWLRQNPHALRRA